jgi:ADP-ribose pyrophosphatase YjhB (NUDIX family)/predicted transcriptional regulator
MERHVHPVQVSILYALRRAPAATFSTLMEPTGLTSDAFKFHMRQLLKMELLEKNDANQYRLTAAGKEFANTLDVQRQAVQKQPKLSVLVVAARTNAAGRREYVFQERQRNPFWGYWSFIGGPVRWGDAIEEAAAHELSKQTGLSAVCTVRSFLRKRDYAEGSDELLEDKVFAIVEAGELSGELQHVWRGGNNAWLTLDDMEAKDRFFAENRRIIEIMDSGLAYGTIDARYNAADY